MKLDRFVSERTGTWQELQELIRRARRRPERLGPARVRRLGELYRSAAADLAFARRRWPSDSVVRSLESLVGAAHPLIYESQARSYRLRDFLATGYWRRVGDNPRLLLLSAALLLAPGLIGYVWGLTDPAQATAFLPGNFRPVAESMPEGDLGLSRSQQAAFASLITTNNIQVSFLAFAGGVLLGLGTALVLLFNGTLLGVVAGLMVGSGNGANFFELVSPHGPLELSCIVVAGATGLRLGWTIVSPGYRSRGTALVEEARGTVEVVLGTIPWFVLAGLIEGFITPTGLGLYVAIVVGVIPAALFWWLVVSRGSRGRSLEADARLGAQVQAHAGGA
ncbi:MAG: stage II sporulation protein M [Actinomycetota bacterium]